MSLPTAITPVDSAARLIAVKALRFASTPRGGAIGLDRGSDAPGTGNCVMAVFDCPRPARAIASTRPERKGKPMRNGSTRPIISVNIGGQLRLFQAYVTTATPSLDGPATMTLYASTFADVAGFAADPIPFSAEFGRQPARIVLVDETKLHWHRANYKTAGCLFAPVDPHLIGLASLQKWLWQRLSAPVPVGAPA